MSTDSRKDAPPRAKGIARTRWPKGQSGNPKGRPKKVAMEQGPVSTEMNNIIMSEAARLITFAEGGKPLTLSAAQAITRASFLSALKGNAHAQRTMLQFTAAAQMALEKGKRDAYAAGVALKIALEDERRKWVARGRLEEDMPRHPNDVELDPPAGEVKIYVLFTEEAVAARAKGVAFRDYAIERMLELLAVPDDEDDELLELARDRAINIIDLFNEELPLWRRRYLPGDSRNPVKATQSPEDIWLEMAKNAASRLLAKEIKSAGFDRDDPEEEDEPSAGLDDEEALE